MVPPHFGKRCGIHLLWEVMWYSPTLRRIWHSPTLGRDMVHLHCGGRYRTSLLWDKIWHSPTWRRSVVQSYFGKRYGTVLLSSQRAISNVGVGFTLYLLQFHFILWHKVGLLFNTVSCHVFFPCLHFFTRIFIEKLRELIKWR